jgi:hypothetical protein
MITHKRLKEVLNYDPNTGIFRWKTTRKLGVKAGSLKTIGYTAIYIDKVMYYAGRLAWFYMTGEWPRSRIDHINRIRDDDRFINLREATQSQNIANSSLSLSNKTGFKGVSKTRSGKWCAQIKFQYTKFHLGTFDTPEEAYEAYKREAKLAFGEYHYKGKD